MKAKPLNAEQLKQVGEALAARAEWKAAQRRASVLFRRVAHRLRKDDVPFSQVAKALGVTGGAIQRAIAAPEPSPDEPTTPAPSREGAAVLAARMAGSQGQRRSGSGGQRMGANVAEPLVGLSLDYKTLSQAAERAASMSARRRGNSEDEQKEAVSDAFVLFLGEIREGVTYATEDLAAQRLETLVDTYLRKLRPRARRPEKAALPDGVERKTLDVHLERLILRLYGSGPEDRRRPSFWKSATLGLARYMPARLVDSVAQR